MLDMISIKGLELFAYHGVNAEEKRDGQHFYLDITMGADLQKACQSAVAAAVGIHHLSIGYLPVCSLINLKLLRMSKMLKYMPILIGHCDFHCNFPPSFLAYAIY